MSAAERVHVRRMEGTNLHVSTQSSSFLFTASEQSLQTLPVKCQ